MFKKLGKLIGLGLKLVDGKKSDASILYLLAYTLLASQGIMLPPETVTFALATGVMGFGHKIYKSSSGVAKLIKKFFKEIKRK